MFPWQKFDPVSWEGHLAGAVSGTLLAFAYRKQGPQKPVKVWEEDDDNDNELSDMAEEDETENDELQQFN